MALHDRLIEFRKQSGMSQLEAAEALDVSRQAISRWETGAARPSTEKLIALSRLYGVPLDELVNGEGPAQAEPKTAEAPSAARRSHLRLWIAAAALALAVLAAIIGAYLLGRGESNGQIIDSGDMEREEITDIDGIDAVPWRD